MIYVIDQISIRSKGRDEALQSNRIVQNYIRYPGSSLKEPGVNSKILEKAIGNLFKYLKSLLPKEMYSNVKTMFIDDINKSNSTLTQDDSVSSITDVIKTHVALWNSGSYNSRHLCQEDKPTKSLKLSYDFLPIAKDINTNSNQAQIPYSTQNINVNLHRNYNSNYINKQHRQSDIYKNQVLLKGNSNHNNNTNKPLSYKHYNLFYDKKHSLYSLTKNGTVINQTRSNSKSQSNSREHSTIVNKRSGLSSNVSFAKITIATNTHTHNHHNHQSHKSIQTNINTISTNNKKQFGRMNTTVNVASYKNAIKKSIITKTQNLLNTKLFSKLQSDLIKMENSKNCSIDIKTNPNHNPHQLQNPTNNDNSNIKNCLNDKCGKKEGVKNHSLDKKKLQSHRNEKELVKEADNTINKNQLLSLCNKTNAHAKANANYQSKTFEGYKDDCYVNHNCNGNSNASDKINNSKRDNRDYFNEPNDMKNSDQLKKIKSSLDDNLKVMFNFSYECFLNRESESESKRSNDDSTKREGDKNQKLTYSYKKKYKY